MAEVFPEVSCDFSRRLIGWHTRHGRHALPWQGTRDPYRVWLSEIMLQQTQVATVVPYYERFLARFPDVETLARGAAAEVMSLWSGLGYYARARNLHRCAQVVVARHGGSFPRDPALIAELPGIGRSTANAIAAFCFGTPAAILDGNVKRVLCRCFGIEGFPDSPPVSRKLWRLAESLLPARDIGSYIQAQMDLGATICKRSKPRCLEDETLCPLASICVARKAARIDALPQPRPRRALPERRARVLVLRDDAGRVLLLSRPPAGIWGGLVSLPELPDAAEPLAHVRTLGCEAGGFRELAPLAHSFTHFRLTLCPLAASVRLLRRVADGAGQHWLSPSEWPGAPLPAPIRKLLAALD